MRKRTNIKNTATRSNSSSLSDLVTHSEDTMSSQASVYSDKSDWRKNVFQATQSRTQNLEFDDYEDIIGEEIDTLFITSEQEKKIQNILQFARKGKINPGNAFEIPVRVIDPQVTESANNRFWKFASQLLFASMSIYDKRVQNMYQNTNRMFDNLIRIQAKPNQQLSDQQVEEKHRKQRGQLIQMDVGDIGKVETLSSYQIGIVNCEEPEKINIKNLAGQFMPDPLFQKRLQAFDSNTLKSLFLNAFECGQDLQIAFFSKQAKQNVVKMQIEKIEEKQEEEEEDYKFEQNIPKFIISQLESLRNLSQNIAAYQNVHTFRNMTIEGPLQTNKLIVKDFTNELKIFKYNHNEDHHFEDLNLDNQNSQVQTQSMNHSNQFNFNYVSSDQTQISDERSMARSMPNSQALQAYPQQSKNSQFLFDDLQQSNSVLTPWELEFKGMKLQKKTKKKGITTETKPRTQRRKPNQLQVNFLEIPHAEKRSIIFLPQKNANLQKCEKYVDKFLVPMAMNHFTDAFAKNKMSQRRGYEQVAQNFFVARQQSETHQQMDVQHEPQQIDEHLSNRNERNDMFEMEIDINSQGFPNFSGLLEQQSSKGHTYKSTSIKNIREIKQKIYEALVHEKTIRLSSLLDIRLTPASILIIFLHLANEKNISLTPIDQYDIDISLSQS